MPSFRGSSQTRDWTHVSLLHLQADSLLLVLPGKPSTHGGRCLLKTHHCTYFMSFNPWQLTKDKTESQKGSENFPKSHRQRFYSVWNTPKPEENGKINNTACVFLWNFYILFILDFCVNFGFLGYCRPSSLSDAVFGGPGVGAPLSLQGPWCCSLPSAPPLGDVTWALGLSEMQSRVEATVH